jgi:hypothetical protein
VSGASDVMLSGTTTSNEVTCSGASEFHGKNLASDIVVAIVGGASNCFVDAKSNLTYDVSGSSEFQYKSTPETVVVKKVKQVTMLLYFLIQTLFQNIMLILILQMLAWVH